MKKIYFAFFLLSAPLLHAQQFAWAFGMGGVDTDSGFDIETDATGNVFVAGGFRASMDADPGAGVSTLTNSGAMDLFVAKYAADGNFLWAFKIGGTGWDGYAELELDASGNVFVTGGFRNTVDFDPGASTFNVTSAGQLDLFIAKYDTNGNFLWVKTIGNTGDDYPDGLDVDDSGNVLACGIFTGTVDFDPGFDVVNLSPTGSQDNFIMKLNPDGIYLWAKKFGSADGETCYDLETDDTGNVYACGHYWGNVDFDPGAGTFAFNAGTFSSQAYALKWDSNGVFVWAGNFGGSGSDGANHLALDDSGNMLITGNFRGTGDFDPGAGVFNLVGESTIFYGDLFVLKLSDAGNFVWAKAAGPAGTLQSGYAIETGLNDDVYVTGLFDGTVDFDPGTGTTNIASAGVGDSFFLKLDSNGEFQWASSAGSTSNDYGNALCFGSGNLYCTGLFTGTNVDLDPTDGAMPVSSVTPTGDVFVIKLGFVQVGCDFTVEVQTTPWDCGGEAGTATAVVSGSGTYTYTWDDAQLQTTGTASNLEAGIYSVIVNDGSCSVSATGTVEVDTYCAADMNNDLLVNVTDLLIFMANFGSATCIGDLDYNGVVNVNDMLIFMAEFGVSCQ